MKRNDISFRIKTTVREKSRCFRVRGDLGSAPGSITHASIFPAKVKADAQYPSKYGRENDPSNS
jgi:hypothetical protein